MNILYKEINKRTAEVIDPHNITIKELFEAWEKEAYEMKDALLSERLLESAKEVQRIIDEQLQFKPKE